MVERPKEPPDQSAPRIVGMLFIEFLPQVKNEYELLEKASDKPLAMSLPDLQIETLIFGLHCLDRAVFAHWGDEYRDLFMDHAFGAACDAFADALEDDLRGPFLELFSRQCRARQQEYGEMKILPGEDGAMKGVLDWEFAKRICFGAGVETPEVLTVFVEEAAAIFSMMNKIAQTL
jgi:hypothetical protein